MEIILRLKAEIEVPEKVKVGKKWFYSDEYMKTILNDKLEKRDEEWKKGKHFPFFAWHDYKEFMIFSYRNKAIRGVTKTYREIGEELGISETRANQIYKKTLEKIRQSRPEKPEEQYEK